MLLSRCGNFLWKVDYYRAQRTCIWHPVRVTPSDFTETIGVGSSRVGAVVWCCVWTGLGLILGLTILTQYSEYRRITETDRHTRDDSALAGAHVDDDCLASDSSVQKPVGCMVAGSGDTKTDRLLMLLCWQRLLLCRRC